MAVKRISWPWHDKRLHRWGVAVACAVLWVSPAARAQIGPVCGDLDLNGSIDVFDADILRDHIAGVQPLSPQQRLLCDVIDETRDPLLEATTANPVSECSVADALVMERDGVRLPPGSGGGCPGGSTGDCCTAHPGVGCNDIGVLACVCAIVPTCCSVGWDATCALLACSGGCSGGGCTAPDPAGADLPDTADTAATCLGGLVVIAGTPGVDALVGGPLDECLVGGAGADSLDGQGGADMLLGGADADNTPGEPGDDIMLGGGSGDTLFGGDGCDLIGGGQGDDDLHGGADADTIVLGTGADFAFGDSGNDVFVVRSACEIDGDERIHGGTGTDLVRSPLTEAELAALGLTTISIEAFALVPKPPELPNGACYPDEQGQLVCECCENGFDPSTLCESCPPGFHLQPDAQGDGDEIGQGGDDPVCVPDVTCQDLDCGGHGTCIENGNDAFCECDCGVAGALCDECDPPWEPDGLGGCYLGEVCGDDLCNGNGECFEDGSCELQCQCDDGWDADSDCGLTRVRIGGPDGAIVGLGSGAYQYAVGLNGAKCNVDFNWSIVQGIGGLVVDGADSKRVTLVNPMGNPAEKVDTIVLRAECGNDPNVFAEHDQTLIQPPQGTFLEGEVSFVEGMGSLELEPFDEAMLEYMDDHNIAGGTLAITYQENLVFLRAYGVRNDAVPTPRPMRTCTPMRVASVSKPFTQAAMVSGIYGTSLPPEFGGGIALASTPVVQILDEIMQLGQDQTVGYQAPPGLYSVTYPQPLCDFNSGRLDPLWNNVTMGRLLAHGAGVWPNQNYGGNGGGPCTGAPNENCRSFLNVGDPMTSQSNLTGIANTLSLDHGVLTLDDIIRWTAGLCLYDDPTAGNYRYSNYGYAAAGRIIEQISGETWEDYLLQFLADNDVVGPTAPGNAFAYQGLNDGSGPASGSVPEHLIEAQYFTNLSDLTDVTTAVFNDPFWEFNNTVSAAYGAFNMDVMYAHGGLVINVEALSNFMHEFHIDSGVFRDDAKGGAGYGSYPNDNADHGGRLPGTAAWIYEMRENQPGNSKNANGAGCLIPANVADSADPTDPLAVDTLQVAPCDLPPGIRYAVIFNTEAIGKFDAGYIGGLHHSRLLNHRLRAAAAEVGDETVWGDLFVLGPDEEDRRIGCDLICPPDAPFCVPITCGNNVVDPGEICDDGNNVSGDGCEADCTFFDPGPSEPGGYAACELANEDPGECLGGPCALIAAKNITLPGPSDTELLDESSAAHPDGNYHPDYFCWDVLNNGGLPWNEATCVPNTKMGQTFGVCTQCEIGNMLGCLCPNPAGPEFGCGLDLTCIGGRCYPESPTFQPDWMCTSDCDDIYGSNSGYCYHDSLKGAVCYPFLCDDPGFPVPYCDEMFGSVCDPGVIGCANDSCCQPECLDDNDCDVLGHTGHFCNIEERCVITP